MSEEVQAVVPKKLEAQMTSRLCLDLNPEELPGSLVVQPRFTPPQNQNTRST